MRTPVFLCAPESLLILIKFIYFYLNSLIKIYSHIPNLGRPNLGRFWEKCKNLSSKNFPNLGRFFAESLFSEKNCSSYEKARDFELFFRGFGVFFAGI
jgi:hypothetical protein